MTHPTGGVDVGPVWIGVDVGGTKVLAGVVDDLGRVVRTARRATPGRRVDIAQVEDALEAAVREAADGAPVAEVWLGTHALAPSTIDAPGGPIPLRDGSW